MKTKFTSNFSFHFKNIKHKEIQTVKEELISKSKWVKKKIFRRDGNLPYVRICDIPHDCDIEQAST